MDRTGVDFAMDVHGDEAIPANFLAGFEGIPSWNEGQQKLFERFAEELVRFSPDFQTRKGYEIAKPGEANMSMSTSQLAERYGAVSMTLEMPFKDNEDLPDPAPRLVAGAQRPARPSLPRRAPRHDRRAARAKALMPTLVLIRHGQSAWNLENRFTGWWDVDLTAKGVEEAKAAGELMAARGLDFDLCFTSLQTRAIKTLNLALEAMGRLWLPVEKDWRLNERHYGGLTGLNKAETAARHGDEQVHVWRRSFDVPPPPMEAGQPLRSRRRSPLCRHRRSRAPRASRTRSPGSCLIGRSGSRRRCEAGQRVLISAHGNSLRALVKHLSDIPDDEITGLEIPTGQPIVYELDEELAATDRYYLSER